MPSTLDLSLDKHLSRDMSKALLPIRYVLLFFRRRPDSMNTFRFELLFEPLATCSELSLLTAFRPGMLSSLFESSSFDLILSKLSTLSDIQTVAVFSELSEPTLSPMLVPLWSSLDPLIIMSARG